MIEKYTNAEVDAAKVRYEELTRMKRIVVAYEG